MTNEERLQAIEDTLDGLTVEEGRYCRERARETGCELAEIQRLFRVDPLLPSLVMPRHDSEVKP